MTKPVWRKIGGKTIIIDMPEHEIILDKDFDYGKYANEYFEDTLAFRDGIYQRHLENLKDIDSSIIFEELPKCSEDEKKINEDYVKKIIALQHQYEEAFQKGYADEINEEITKTMQYLTSDYVAKLDTLNDTNELDKLSGKTK